MLLGTSGLQGVSIWRFLFHCDMSFGDGILLKLLDFSPEKKLNSPPDDFSPGKKWPMSPSVELSYAKENKPLHPPPINQLIKQVFKRQRTHRLV
jgi:hypothetical protein